MSSPFSNTFCNNNNNGVGFNNEPNTLFKSIINENIKDHQRI